MGDNLKDLHVRIGEQNIDSESFDDILLRGNLKYPSIKFSIGGRFSIYSLNALRNCFNLKEGSHFFVIEVGGRLRNIGKLDLNIDNVYRLESLFKRLGPVIEVIEGPDEEFRKVTSKDLISTLELDIKEE